MAVKLISVNNPTKPQIRKSFPKRESCECGVCDCVEEICDVFRKQVIIRYEVVIPIGRCSVETYFPILRGYLFK